MVFSSFGGSCLWHKGGIRNIQVTQIKPKRDSELAQFKPKHVAQLQKWLAQIESLYPCRLQSIVMHSSWQAAKRITSMNLTELKHIFEESRAINNKISTATVFQQEAILCRRNRRISIPLFVSVGQIRNHECNRNLNG